MSHTAMLAVC